MGPEEFKSYQNPRHQNLLIWSLLRTKTGLRKLVRQLNKDLGKFWGLNFDISLIYTDFDSHFNFSSILFCCFLHFIIVELHPLSETWSSTLKPWVLSFSILQSFCIICKFIKYNCSS